MRTRVLSRTAIAAGCVAAWLGGTGPGAAGAAPVPRQLVGTAAYPGVAEPQTVSMDLRRYLRSTNARFLRSPSADTAVIGVPDTAFTRRGRRWADRKVTPCAEVRVTLSLHFAQPDPLRLAADLVPHATTLEYQAGTRTGDALGVGVPPDVSVLRVDERATRRVGTIRAATEVMDWRHRGRYGLSAITATSTALRVTGRCAGDRGDWSLQELTSGASRVAGGA